MVTPASSEFVALCRSQIALLTQGLGASLGIVYLAENWVEEEGTKLVAIAADPELGGSRERAIAALPQAKNILQLPAQPLTATRTASQQDKNPKQQTWQQKRQLILPLVHEDAVMGLLVTAREDRAWNAKERAQIDQIVQTIALACVLDQRANWLDQQRRQLRQIQVQQNRILDNLLHQFRNPLTAVRTFGKLLLKRLQATDNNRSAAEGIVRESDRLQELLQQFDRAIDFTNEFLEPVALETPPPKQPLALLPEANSLGSDSLTLEPCAIGEILIPLLNSATAIAQERYLSLQAEIPADLPLVPADQQALREVLSNMIDNALKYTPAGGQVKIHVQTGDRLLTIAIHDTGYGIPPQDLTHIFERHYRGVQAQTDIPGTGLGLAIAKELVQRMHGEIQVFSPALEPPDSQRGSTFRVQLPILDSSELPNPSSESSLNQSEDQSPPL